MAVTWKQVAGTQDYQKLSTEDRNAVRADFFTRVIAPQVDTADLEAVHADFMARTQPGFIDKAKDYLPEGLGGNKATGAAPEVAAPPVVDATTTATKQENDWYAQARKENPGAGEDVIAARMTEMANAGQAAKEPADTGIGMAPVAPEADVASTLIKTQPGKFDSILGEAPKPDMAMLDTQGFMKAQAKLKQQTDAKRRMDAVAATMRRTGADQQTAENLVDGAKRSAEAAANKTYLETGSEDAAAQAGARAQDAALNPGAISEMPENIKFQQDNPLASSALSGTAKFVGGAWGAADAVHKAIDPANNIGAVVDYLTGLGEPDFGKVADRLNAMGDQFTTAMQKQDFSAAYAKGNGLEWMLTSAVGNAPSLASSAVGIFNPAAAGVMLGTMAASAGGGQYRELINQGYDQSIALLSGIAHATLEYALERVPIEVGQRLLTEFKALSADARANLGRRIVGAMSVGAGMAGTEGLEELGTQFGQNAADIATGYAQEEVGGATPSTERMKQKSVLDGAMNAFMGGVSGGATHGAAIAASVMMPDGTRQQVDPSVAAAEAAKQSALNAWSGNPLTRGQANRPAPTGPLTSALAAAPVAPSPVVNPVQTAPVDAPIQEAAQNVPPAPLQESAPVAATPQDDSQDAALLDRIQQAQGGDALQADELLDAPAAVTPGQEFSDAFNALTDKAPDGPGNLAAAPDHPDADAADGDQVQGADLPGSGIALPDAMPGLPGADGAGAGVPVGDGAAPVQPPGRPEPSEALAPQPAPDEMQAAIAELSAVLTPADAAPADAPAAYSRTLDEKGRAMEGGSIKPGEVFSTLSGRKTTPFPKQKGEKYASQWLIDNATAEAESRGDHFNAPVFKRTKTLKYGALTAADRESMLMYLFDQQPAVVPSILKPLTGNVTSLTDAKAKLDALKASTPLAPKKVKHPSGSLIQRIKQLGGINLANVADVIGERKAINTPPGLFQKRVAGKSGTQSGFGLDELAIMLEADGFPIDTHTDTDNGGVNQLTDLIQQALGGMPVYTQAEGEHQRRKEEDRSNRDRLVDEAQAMGIATTSKSAAQISAAIDAIHEQESQIERDAIQEEVELSDAIEEEVNDLPFGESPDRKPADLDTIFGANWDEDQGEAQGPDWQEAAPAGLAPAVPGAQSGGADASEGADEAAAPARGLDDGTPEPDREGVSQDDLDDAFFQDRHDHLFDDPAQTTRAEEQARAAGFMPQAAADTVLQGWVETAKAQTGNGGKTILSLFDRTGVWSQPYVDAGYNVVRVDLADGIDVNDFSVEYLIDTLELDDVVGVLAACPCTDFSASGARWWNEKDADGRTEASIELVRQTLRTIEYFNPTFWAIENPVGRIQRVAGLPEPRLIFQPHHYGDPYTKKTLLYGQFNADLPQANVEPTEGSRVHKLRGNVPEEKEARSTTPEGFAYAFFMANAKVTDRAVEPVAVQAASPSDVDPQAQWDKMGYGQRQTIAEASEIGGLRRVVHRIAGSKWSDLGPGERDSVAKVMAAIQGAASPEQDKPALELVGQTPEEAKAEADAIAASAKAEKDAADKIEADAKKKRIADEVTSRQEESANNFVLGQSAEDALAGQGDIFSAPPSPPAKPKAQPAPVGIAASDIPPMILQQIAVTMPVINTRTNMYQQREVSATEAISTTDADIKQMQALLDCLKA